MRVSLVQLIKINFGIQSFWNHINYLSEVFFFRFEDGKIKEIGRNLTYTIFSKNTDEK